MFYDPKAKLEIHTRYLPHWWQGEKIYFVTFRLADSIPKEQLKQIMADRDHWRRNNSSPYSQEQLEQYHTLFSERIEALLDNHHGECILAQSECANIISNAMTHFQGERYCLDHWVVMPNHVHALLLPLDKYHLADILQGWKSFSARLINVFRGKKGSVWQQESFDHIVRSESHLMKFRAYIIDNAAKCPHRSRLSTEKIDVTKIM